MEEENKVEVQEEVKTETEVKSNKFDFKNIDFKNINYKKYLPYAGIALAVIVVIIILALVLGGGPKKAVKNFIGGMNSKNASKIVKNMDFAGISAWGYSYDEDDFSKDDYKDFIEDYKDVEKDEIKTANKTMKKYLEEGFEDIKDEYKTYKFKIEKFKEVKKLGKDLYAIDAKISLVAKPKDKDETDEIDDTKTLTFIVYKNKLISFGGLGL